MNIDKLKEAITVVSESKNSATWDDESSKKFLDAENCLTDLARSYIKTMESGLPEKKSTSCKSEEHINYHCFGDSDCPECTQNVGFNTCYDLMLPHLVELRKENEELKAEVKRLKGEICP